MDAMIRDYMKTHHDLWFGIPKPRKKDTVESLRVRYKECKTIAAVAGLDESVFNQEVRKAAKGTEPGELTKAAGLIAAKARAYKAVLSCS
jgi:hypothetical protein